MSQMLRVARAGLAAAILVGLFGWGVERVRFGSTDAVAVARVEAELRQRFDRTAGTLGALAARVGAARATIRAAARDPAALEQLFDLVESSLPGPSGGAGITVYGPDALPLAWAGRVTDLPKQRLAGSPALLVAPGALGPRLVRIDPVVDPDGGRAAPPLATVVVEQSLGTLAEGQPASGGTATIATSMVPVTLNTQLPAGSEASLATRAAAGGRQYRFAIPGSSGAPLVDAEVAASDLAAARARIEDLTRAGVLLVCAVTLLLAAGPLIDVRRRHRDARPFLLATLGLVGLLLGARAVLSFVGAPLWARGLSSPLGLPLTAMAAAALAWIALDLIERRRLARPHPPLVTSGRGAAAKIAAAFAAAGALNLWLLWTYERSLLRIVSQTRLDLLHFSLHPFEPRRLGVAFGLVILHAAVVWTAVAMTRVPAMLWRTPRWPGWRALACAAWLGGALAATIGARAIASAMPIGPLWAALAVAGAAAVVLARVSGRVRHVSQAARLGTLFLALLVPALAMYPSLYAFATDAKERLVATVYGPEATSERSDLEQRLRRTLEQIDALPSLADYLAGLDVATPAADRAFLVWSRTDLATYRLTSAIELYDREGRIVSRFAILPEYITARYRPSGCTWAEPVDEVSPFGSSERHVLRTSRAICVGARVVGGIVVRVMLDPTTLPFISSQNPYLESLRPNRQAPPEGQSGRDVEFAMYGWSRAPTYATGTKVWSLPDQAFARMVASRDPFWTTIRRDGETFRVYLLNDRGGIYALGYPVITWVGHLINVAELVLLAGALYVALLVGAALFGALALGTPSSGRSLLREVRSSFYMKLFLSFVLAAVLPVAILAVTTRTYFANQLLTGAEDSAARTVTTAQRLVEDYASLQQRGPGALDAIDDQIMVLVRRAIDEDVNLFDRQSLQATSARDLFASQLLPTRTPGDVYRAILLDRLPTFVGDEEVGDAPYRLAAAPVRAGGREGIVTVPLTNHQQEIEQRIDELDRRVVSAAVLFILMGAAFGYWMAERVADPVRRLTRATRRIARGDLDARIAATSSDELRRLVEDFNQMAADLKRQRAELERTQRLEAWADMARQVAHDVKNPLTPIQLSAEHARRVNLDRGRPLSPVLDECVEAILTQVKLLRQISAEFSSFASSPTPRPEPTTLADVVEAVVSPYRTGLAGRVGIEVDAPPDLPPALIDRTLFARALTNVIENALHAMPGGGRLTIVGRLSSTNGRPWIRVEISDTGVGMDQEALTKIFEPYFSTKATGTGLGLTIAKRNIELVGGVIAVRSERGVGTTVSIGLPIGSEAEA